MKLALGHAFNLKQLFENLKTKKLNYTIKQSKEICGNEHKDVLAKRIFIDNMKIVLNDIIDNNVTFELPTGARKSSIYVDRTSGEDFKQARKNGKWKEVDYLKSFFSGYQLVLRMESKKFIRKKPIYLDKRLKEKLTNYVNQGRQYY